MDTLSELKRIRAGTHQWPVKAIENALDRLIATLERPDFPFPSYTLTSFDIEIIHE